MSAAIATREGIVALNKRRQADGEPVTDMYLGLHVGDVFYGNVGGRERLDFTVIGPAVNEASRIAAMCRSVDQPVLMSSAFADVGAWFRLDATPCAALLTRRSYLRSSRVHKGQIIQRR